MLVTLDTRRGFFQIWQQGYFHPAEAFHYLRNAPAPLYGLWAILLRCGFISLIWMLPRAWMRLQPVSIPSLAFLTYTNYYWHAIWIYPVFELSRWLFQAALTHLILRLGGQASRLDQVLNIAGIGSLIIEPAVRAWDWILFLTGWNKNLLFMGLSHAVLAWPWSLVLIAIAYKKIMNIPPRWSVPLGFLASLLIIPLSVLFLRP